MRCASSPEQASIIAIDVMCMYAVDDDMLLKANACTLGSLNQ